MASRGTGKQQSSTADDIPLRNYMPSYEEDEYGYVATNDKAVSRELISQLPSRQPDLVDQNITQSSLSDATLRKRFSKYRTLTLKQSLSCQSVDDVDKICELINTDPDATYEDKIKTLREMKQSLTVKRLVKLKLDADLRRRKESRTVNTLTRLKYRSHMVWHKVLFGIKNNLYSLEPWHRPIKNIQGQFGSGVASYFIFLRWLLYINIFNFLISFFFVIIPQITYESSGKLTNNASEAFHVYDLLTGSGSLTDSYMYFGYYTHEVLGTTMYYNMPLAYVLVVFITSIINLIAVSYSLTSSYQKNYIYMAVDLKHVFCNKILSAWDFSIETEEAAQLRKIAFCNEIKELLAFSKKESRRKSRAEAFLQGSLMIFVNLFCLGIVSAAGYLIYYLMEKKALKVDVKVLGDMTLALTVTFISSSFYFILKYCTRLEYFLTRKTKMYLTMIRVVILRGSMLGIIVYFWMIANDKVSGKLNECHETQLGKEIYRLILVHFLMSVIFLTFCGAFLRKIISVYIWKNMKVLQFDVAINTLDLIYYQTLAWIGSFCVPFASLILIILLIVLFYIKLCSASTCCRPPKRTWSINEAQTFFLTLTFLMFLLSTFTVFYVLFALEPSVCGPFKYYQHAGDAINELFFERGEEHEANEIVKYISSPGVMFAFFSALCVLVYFMRAQAQAHIANEKKVRDQLIMEGKDKVFLLKLFEDALSAHAQEKANEKDQGKKKKILH